MFKKKAIKKGLVCLVAIGIIAGTSQAEWWEFWKKETKVVVQTKLKENPGVAKGKSEPVKAKATQEKGTPTIKEIYVPKEVLNLTWGEGNYQVGVQRGPEIEFVGPQEIRIDKKGNIRILDTINGRILRYNTEGGFIDKINIEKWVEKFCIRKDGIIYTWGENLIMYDSKGKILRRWKCHYKPGDKEAIPSPFFLHLDKDDNIVILDYLEGEFYKIQFNKDGICKKAEKTKGPYSMKVKIKDFKELILIDQNKVKSEIKVEEKGGLKYFINDIIGEDEKKNIYIFVDVMSKGIKGESNYKEGYYEVRKYSKEGNLITAIKLPPLFEFRNIGTKRIDIDKEGNIYYLQTLETGVKVIKYELQ